VMRDFRQREWQTKAIHKKPAESRPANREGQPI
jgi:hypothetical protein